MDSKGSQATAEISDDIVYHQLGFSADYVKHVLKEGSIPEKERVTELISGNWPHDIRGSVKFKITGGAEEGAKVEGYDGGKDMHLIVVGWEWEKGRKSAD